MQNLNFMKDNPTPPRFCRHNGSKDDGLPDFIAGHLIYYDSENGCHWVIYDGDIIRRFASRTAAEKFAIEQSTMINDETVERLMVAYQRLRDTSDSLGRIFLAGHAEQTRRLQSIAAQIRRLSDDVDAITAQFIDGARLIRLNDGQ